MKVYSQITFFYYKNYKAACDFYENIFNFEIVQDQKMAKIYRIGKSFFGIVDGEKGSLRPQPDNAVMLTIIVDNVTQWYEYLKGKNVKEIKSPSKGVCAESAFFMDPGGYVIEIQRFINNEIQREFES